MSAPDDVVIVDRIEVVVDTVARAAYIVQAVQNAVAQVDVGICEHDDLFNLCAKGR